MPVSYPTSSDPQSAGHLADGSTVAHRDEHSRIIGMAENVKGWGAKGDATTDDSAVIQSVLSGSQYVYLPPGNYKISSGLTLQAGQHLIGAGPINTSILTHQGAANAISLDYGAGTNNAFTFIGGFSLGWNWARNAGPVPTATGHSIYLNGGAGGSNGVRIDDIYFCVPQGISGTSSWALYNNNFLETLVSRCTVLDPVGGSFYFKGNSNMSTVRECYLQGGGSSGFGSGLLGGILNEAARLVVSGTVIEANRGAYGLKCNSAGGTIQSSASLYGVWFEDIYGYDIIVDRGCAVDAFGCNITSPVSGSSLGSVQFLTGGTNDSWFQMMGGYMTGKITVANSSGQPVHLSLTNALATATIDTSGVADANNFFRSEFGGKDSSNLSGKMAATRVTRSKVTLTDGASVSTDASLGDFFTLSAGGSRTMNTPTNASTGQQITYVIKNNTGGAITTNWAGGFVLAGAWTDPATTKRRTITFYYDGTSWVELNRGSADMT